MISSNRQGTRSLGYCAKRRRVTFCESSGSGCRQRSMRRASVYVQEDGKMLFAEMVKFFRAVRMLRGRGGRGGGGYTHRLTPFRVVETLGGHGCSLKDQHHQC